jgi:hypothetical protein
MQSPASRNKERPAPPQNDNNTLHVFSVWRRDINSSTHQLIDVTLKITCSHSTMHPSHRRPHCLGPAKLISRWSNSYYSRDLLFLTDRARQNGMGLGKAKGIASISPLRPRMSRHICPAFPSSQSSNGSGLPSTLHRTRIVKSRRMR